MTYLIYSTFRLGFSHHQSSYSQIVSIWGCPFRTEKCPECLCLFPTQVKLTSCSHEQVLRDVRRHQPFQRAVLAVSTLLKKAFTPISFEGVNVKTSIVNHWLHIEELSLDLQSRLRDCTIHTLESLKSKSHCRLYVSFEERKWQNLSKLNFSFKRKYKERKKFKSTSISIFHPRISIKTKSFFLEIFQVSLPSKDSHCRVPTNILGMSMTPKL